MKEPVAMSWAGGNRHCAVYKDKEDFVTFLNLVASVKARYPFTLHAYCLMTNHFHLLITTSNDPIWKIMQPIVALSDVLYVVDAGRNSGTLTTVKSAVKYGRNVL